MGWHGLEWDGMGWDVAVCDADGAVPVSIALHSGQKRQSYRPLDCGEGRGAVRGGHIR